MNPNLKWHRSCYSKFTHQGMLNRLEKKQEAMLKTTLEPAAFTANVQHTSTRSRREHNINREICMFYQKKEGKNLQNVMTMHCQIKFYLWLRAMWLCVLG